MGALLGSEGGFRDVVLRRTGTVFHFHPCESWERVDARVDEEGVPSRGGGNFKKGKEKKEEKGEGEVN